MMNHVLRTVIILLCLLLPRYAEAQQDVSVYNSAAQLTLCGTLALPHDTPKAILVLASGSGDQNRDEEVAGHKPFKTIADSLAAHGYGTLRMDDRGVGCSEGSNINSTIADRASDISAALAFVKQQFPDVPTGVLGHSEGGLSAIMNAVECPDCEFIITLASPAWPTDSIVMSQVRSLSVASTGKWEQEALERQLLDVAMSDLPDYQVRAMLSVSLNQALSPELRSIPKMQEYVNAQLDAMLSPWFRSLLRLDPASYISAVKVPWLALNGTKDLQVLPGNLQTISELNPQANTVLLPDHNHLFQVCTTGLPDEYARISGDISPMTIQEIVKWLDGHY